MGLFNKLFGRKDKGNNDTTPLFTKTGDLLNEDLYWQIVQESLDNTTSQEEQEAFLADHLAELTPSQIIGFKLRTMQLQHGLYTPETWCAAYLINQGCSDDGFEYFRSWIISRGKEIYYQVKQNPDFLADIIGEGGEDYEFEAFDYAANVAFQGKTQKVIYDYMDDQTVQQYVDHNMKFNWEEDDPESQKAICPKLYERYGE